MITMRLVILLFLGFGSVISSFAVPSTRSLRSIAEDDVSVVAADLILAHQNVARDTRNDALAVRRGDQVDKMAENAVSSEELNFIEGRMDMENDDYTGAGANNHHDPKGPGTD